jgi:hypothetical protein
MQTFENDSDHEAKGAKETAEQAEFVVPRVSERNLFFAC